MPDDWLAATLQRTRDSCSGHQVGFPGFLSWLSSGAERAAGESKYSTGF